MQSLQNKAFLQCMSDGIDGFRCPNTFIPSPPSSPSSAERPSHWKSSSNNYLLKKGLFGVLLGKYLYMYKFTGTSTSTSNKHKHKLIQHQVPRRPSARIPHASNSVREGVLPYKLYRLLLISFQAEIASPLSSDSILPTLPLINLLINSILPRPFPPQLLIMSTPSNPRSTSPNGTILH